MSGLAPVLVAVLMALFLVVLLVMVLVVLAAQRGCGRKAAEEGTFHRQWRLPGSGKQCLDRLPTSERQRRVVGVNAEVEGVPEQWHR